MNTKGARKKGEQGPKKTKKKERKILMKNGAVDV
jgi:hypothetical protein